jgi:chromosome segregation ATPase
VELTLRSGGRHNANASMESERLANEIAGLEHQLATLQSHESADRSAFADLEERLSGLSRRIAYARKTAAECEQRLEGARAELAVAKRTDALIEAQRQVKVVAEQLAENIEGLAAGLDAYDQARRAVEVAKTDLSAAGLAHLVREDETMAGAEDRLREHWKLLVTLIGRAERELDEELVEAAARSPMGHAISNLPPHLRDPARRRRDAHLLALKRGQRLERERATGE